jgi:hypothetical protein
MLNTGFQKTPMKPTEIASRGKAIQPSKGFPLMAIGLLTEACYFAAVFFFPLSYEVNDPVRQ